MVPKSTCRDHSGLMNTLNVSLDSNMLVSGDMQQSSHQSSAMNEVSVLKDDRSAPSKSLRALIVSSDLYPPTRVDVTVLFGQELSARGHTADLILQSETECHASHVEAWGGGQIWVGATDLGTSLWSRLRKHVLGITHDLKLFPLLRSGTFTTSSRSKTSSCRAYSQRSPPSSIGSDSSIGSRGLFLKNI
jgi:hypothetical protein